MTFRIETATRGTVRVFILSGRLETQAIGELRRLIECQTDCHDIESLSDVEATRKGLRKIWARTSTSIRQSTMPQRYCSVWAGPERFSQQPPVAPAWGHLCPVWQPAASSSWWVYRRTRSN